MRRLAAGFALVGVMSSCSLFGTNTVSTTSSSASPTTTAATTTSSTTTTTTVPPQPRIDDLPEIDRDSPAALIRVAQRLTRVRGFPTTVDGIFGRQTRARLVALREQVGLDAVPTVDPALWEALFDAQNLPSGQVNAEVINPVPAAAGLQVPEIAILYTSDVEGDEIYEHYLIPFHVDGPMFSRWAVQQAAAQMDGTWTICEPMTGTGEDLVIVTGVSELGQTFSYRVVAMGLGRVDIRIQVGSSALAQCP